MIPSGKIMRRLLPACLALLVLASGRALAFGWLTVDSLRVEPVATEFGGLRVGLSYFLADSTVSPDRPAYVFVRWSADGGNSWRLLSGHGVTGELGVVNHPGRCELGWWGAGELGIESPESLEFRVRALPMARVPAGGFRMLATPGGGNDAARAGHLVSSLPTFFIARYEVTTAIYADYLNEQCREGGGWDPNMAGPRGCGIIREGEAPPLSYRVAEGRERFPVSQVSWYDAAGFLAWCGLELPTEAEWEKAYRGGLFLDGDSTRQVANPLPERKFPWGDEAPDQDGRRRCNVRGPEDGFPDVAPVGSFPDFPSPYGVQDLAGNLAEWTLDWYSTSYHAGLDGFRMVRGGSWRSSAVAVDAISGATSLPLRQSGIMGLRGVLRPGAETVRRQE